MWRQYDRIVQGNTVAGPESDGAVIRVPSSLKGVVVSSDGKGRFGRLDPYLGAMHAVAESARNVAVTGARPLAITNCLNFGNPERPEVMWQFAESIRGIRDACEGLGTPVTGGNVSFYNESGDSAIDPTPVIGMLGLLPDYRLRVPSAFPGPGLAIYLVGETAAELGGSEFAEAVLGSVDRHAAGARPGPGAGTPRSAGGRGGRRRSSSARTTAGTAGSRWPSPNARSGWGMGSPCRSPPICPRTWPCSASRHRARS